MLTISKQELQINEEIRDKEVLLIDVDGTKLGVISARDAQKMAYEKDLDLVKIAPNAKPPVCRILDYGKFCFEQAKKEKEARKNQKVVEIKEIRMFSAIDTHDFNTKVNQAIKFLKNGDKLKVSVRFRKRAIAHPQLGEELLNKFKEACAEAALLISLLKWKAAVLLCSCRRKHLLNKRRNLLWQRLRLKLIQALRSALS